MKVEGKGPWKERQDEEGGRAVVLSLRVNDKIISALADHSATITFNGATKVKFKFKSNSNSIQIQIINSNQTPKQIFFTHLGFFDSSLSKILLNHESYDPFPPDLEIKICVSSGACDQWKRP